ncbi:MAG: ARPP-1 family domain-containing protein [Candidatus Helarchaeota archaeon]
MIRITNVEAIRKFATQVINMEGLEIGSPVILDEVTFVPIIKQITPRDERDYLTLSEALDEGLCKIIDKGTEVAHILFQNLSEIDPILIEEGEIFLGKGTQDRICISTILVQPGETVEIPVKCVHAPHHLAAGAAFAYGGKASRRMLNELRSMKLKSAQLKSPVSTISQSRVWNNVAMETLTEDSITDPTQYTQAVKARNKRAKMRSKAIKLPKNTIGIVVIDSDGNVKGLEIHRNPHNFKVRKAGILESLDANISWDKTGKGAYPKVKEKVKTIFKQLSEIKEGKDALTQVEVDGTVINVAGVAGEVLTSKFYSSLCPSCGAKKPRIKICPHCGSEEEASDEIAFMSFA